MNKHGLPVVIGPGRLSKQGIGIKSKLGSGYDIYILDNDMKKQFSWLHFCSPENIEHFIGLLQDTRTLWEREEEMSNGMGKNAEGYLDPTVLSAWRNIRKEENRREAERTAVISNLIPIMKQTAELAGFEVVGRIVLKDKCTGKEYR